VCLDVCQHCIRRQVPDGPALQRHSMCTAPPHVRITGGTAFHCGCHQPKSRVVMRYACCRWRCTCCMPLHKNLTCSIAVRSLDDDTSSAMGSSMMRMPPARPARALPLLPPLPGAMSRLTPAPRLHIQPETSAAMPYLSKQTPAYSAGLSTGCCWRYDPVRCACVSRPLLLSHHAVRTAGKWKKAVPDAADCIQTRSNNSN
jgi:hypothetical protein